MNQAAGLPATAPGPTHAAIERRRPAAPPDPLAEAMSRLAAAAPAITSRPAAIEAVDVTCRAGERVLLDRVCVRAAPGELVALLGPSGSGKSTLLRALAGERIVDAGHIRSRGVIAEAPRLQRQVGYVPQDDVLHEELTPAQALGALARLHLPAALRASRVAEVLALLELVPCRDVQAARLSGGQRQRLSLGLELVLAPRVVLLDEPTASLDPALQARLMALLRRLADGGRAVVVSTHQLEHLSRFDRVVVLRDGRVLFDGTPADALAGVGDDAGALLERLPDPARRARMARGGGPAAPHDPVGLAVAARQLPVLAAREVALLAGDPRRAGLLLLQAPVIALALAIGLSQPAPLLFLLVLAAVWCGTTTGARAVVRERAVLARERRHGVAPCAALAAKVLVLAALTSLQTALLLAGVLLARDVPGAPAALLCALLAAGVTGLLVGLGVSALARTSDQANALVPLVLIPQVLFTVAPSPSEPLANAVARLMPTRWAHDLAVRVARASDPRARASLVPDDEHQDRLAHAERLEGELERALGDVTLPSGTTGADRAGVVQAGLEAASLELGQRTATAVQRAAEAQTEAKRMDRILHDDTRRARRLAEFRRTGRWPGRAPGADSLKTLEEDLRRARDTTRTLVEDVPRVEQQARALAGRLRRLQDGLEATARAREAFARRGRELEALLEEVDAEAAEGTAAAARARAARAEATRLADALAALRVALRREATGLVHLEPWGSPGLDGLALVGFGLAGLLVALRSLERARS